MLQNHYALSPFLAGDYGEEVPPVPIPNTAVKLLSGDGTAAEGRGRVARCQPFYFESPFRHCRSGLSFFAPRCAPGVFIARRQARAVVLLGRFFDCLRGRFFGCLFELFGSGYDGTDIRNEQGDCAIK